MNKLKFCLVLFFLLETFPPCLFSAAWIQKKNDTLLFTSFGLNTALKIEENHISGLLGAEISTGIFHNSSDIWYGAYMDTQYVFEDKVMQYSLGPELGYKFAGLDGGLVIREGKKQGFALRILLSFLYLHPYLRFVKIEKSHYTEAGLLFKFPLPLLKF